MPSTLMTSLSLDACSRTCVRVSVLRVRSCCFRCVWVVCLCMPTRSAPPQGRFLHAQHAGPPRRRLSTSYVSALPCRCSVRGCCRCCVRHVGQVVRFHRTCPRDSCGGGFSTLLGTGLHSQHWKHLWLMRGDNVDGLLLAVRMTRLMIEGHFANRKGARERYALHTLHQCTLFTIRGSLGSVSVDAVDSAFIPSQRREVDGGHP